MQAESVLRIMHVCVKYWIDFGRCKTHSDENSDESSDENADEISASW